MSKTTAEQRILGKLAAGPKPRRKLLLGASVVFKLAYQRLLAARSIVEYGAGIHGQPIFVGLPGTHFPDRILTVRQPDVRLLVRSGMAPDEAKQALRNAIDSGAGNNKEALIRVLLEAHTKIIEKETGRIPEFGERAPMRGRGRPPKLPTF